MRPPVAPFVPPIGEVVTPPGVSIDTGLWVPALAAGVTVGLVLVSAQGGVDRCGLLRTRSPSAAGMDSPHAVLCVLWQIVDLVLYCLVSEFGK